MTFDAPLATMLAAKAQAGDDAARSRLLACLEPIALKEAGCFEIFAVSLVEREQAARVAALKAAMRWRPGKGTTLRTFVARCVYRALVDEFRRSGRDASRTCELSPEAQAPEPVKRIDVAAALAKRFRAVEAGGQAMERSGTALLLWQLRKAVVSDDPETVCRELAAVYLEIAARIEAGVTDQQDPAQWRGYGKRPVRTIVGDLLGSEPVPPGRKRQSDHLRRVARSRRLKAKKGAGRKKGRQ